ncbi:MAG: endolytic transglycosylase MltG [Acutalibacteraceae bacterium]
MSNRSDESSRPQQDLPIFTAPDPQPDPQEETVKTYEPAVSPAPPDDEDAPVSLVDKAAQFQQTRVIEKPEMISLSDYGDAPLPEEEEPLPAPAVTRDPDTSRKRSGKKRAGQVRTWRPFRGILYAIFVVGASLLATYLIISSILDVTGLQKSDIKKEVVIDEGATTAEVANALNDAGLIDQKLIFRLFSRLTKADGKYQPGTFYLSANMGYGSMIEALQEIPYRESVTITIPEGCTVENIARLLSVNGVCSYSDFYAALVSGQYDYEFMRDIPTVGEAGYEERIYRLEGYLFPDTYEFYKDISGEAAIDKLLGNFHDRLTDPDNGDGTPLLTMIKTDGRPLDEIITLASIVQGEAADTANMPKVSRVILNRLDNYAEFPYLQCDSTGDYVTKLSSEQVDVDTEDSAYDTYTHMGLPPGPINCPGLAAIKAVLTPSTDERIMKCYYFANDAARNTYYSETYEQHVAVCREHNIGIHAN